MLAARRAAAPRHAVAQAQDPYPSKPITIVVPYPPGGSNDSFARQVGKALGDALKTTVIVDNRPGASGNTGTGQVAKAAPDGYTLVAVSSSMTTNAAIQPKMPFDPIKGFAPVAMMAKGPFIVAVNNDVPGQDARRAGRRAEGATGQAQLRLVGHRQQQPVRHRDAEGRDRHLRWSTCPTAAWARPSPG